MKKVRISGDRDHPLTAALIGSYVKEKELVRRYLEVIPNDGYPLNICLSPKDVEEEENECRECH